MNITKGSTNVSVVIRIVDDTDGTPETAVVYNTTGIDMQYRREGAASTSITEVTLAALTTAHTDGGFLHIGNGYYRVDIPDAAFATGVNGVLIHGTVTGMVVVGVYVQLTDVDLFDAVRAGLSALPNAAADGAGGLVISDAGGLDVDALNTAAIRLTAARAQVLDDWINAGRLDLILDIIAADVVNIDGAAMRGTDSAAVAGDAMALTTAASAQLVDEMADEPLTGGTHNVVNSWGRRIRNLQEFGTYEGGAIFIDTVNGSAGTTDYESGTFMNAVNTIADANTLAASLGIAIFNVLPATSITFVASQDNQDFRGNSWTLALGGQSISASHIQGATVSGVCTGASIPEFHECQLGNMTIPAARLKASEIEGTITLPAANVDFHHCNALVSGVLDYGSAVANTTVNLTDFSGALTINNLGQSGTDILNIRGHGTITLAASCVGGTINHDGHISIINNGSGITINADDISTSVASILAATAAPAKNTAFSNMSVLMVDSTDSKSPLTGLTLGVTRSIDGGAFGSGTGTAAEIANGMYQYDASAADMNGDVIIFRFTGTGADDTFITVYTRP